MTTDLDKVFTPDFDPITMFEMGIFEGNYFKKELGLTPIKNLNFPRNAYKALSKIDNKKLSNPKPSIEINYYKSPAGTDYNFWNDKGWINEEDPYGWVNWYINYYYGRRGPNDKRQIVRWNAFKIRHRGMLRKYPNSNKIKQGLLQWGINPEKL